MTRHERRIEACLRHATAGLGREEAIAHLLRLGLVSMRRCEHFLIRNEVERLTGQGLGRCEAMEVVSVSLHCSYAKVREAVYYKPKI